MPTGKSVSVTTGSALKSAAEILLVKRYRAGMTLIIRILIGYLFSVTYTVTLLGLLRWLQAVGSP